jgi:hypothetical protein
MTMPKVIGRMIELAVASGLTLTILGCESNPAPPSTGNVNVGTFPSIGGPAGAGDVPKVDSPSGSKSVGTPELGKP